MKPIFLIAAICVLIAGVLLTAFFTQPSKETSLSGLVQAKEIKNASRFGGRVKKVLVKEGDVVHQGEKVLIFDDIELRSKIAEARAQLNQAKAKYRMLSQGADIDDLRQASSQVQQAEQNLKLLSHGARPEEITQGLAKVQEAQSQLGLAKSTYEHSQQMLQEGVISQQKYDEMKEQYQNAQSVLESAQANLKVLKSGSRPEQVSIARSQLASVKAQYQKLVKGAKKEELEIANATIEQAQSVLTALEAQLSELSITAPIDGMITILSVNEGELVSPNRPVVSIIDYSHLWSDIFIQESSLNQVKIGQTVRVTAPAYPKSVFTGHVVFVSPKSEFVPNGNGSSPTEQSSFRVKINIDYWDSTHAIQLHPGMKVTVFFQEAA